MKTTHNLHWLVVAGLGACSILSACQHPGAEMQSPHEEMFNGIRVKYEGVDSEEALRESKAYAHKYLVERGYTKDSVGDDGISFGQDGNRIVAPFTTYEALFTHMKEGDLRWSSYAGQFRALS